MAVCQSLVDEALKHHPTGNVALLPDVPHDGVAEGRLPRPLMTAQGPPHGVRFMYVGNLEPYQGVDLMLEAFRRLELDEINATLLVVGGSNTHVEAYSDKARSLVTTGRVRFVGALPIERLGRVLQCADVLVSPRTQGVNTPMKLYSYLQSGKPVLATRLPTHTQVVDDETAVLVEPKVDAMTRAMQRLAESPELREGADWPRRPAAGGGALQPRGVRRTGAVVLRRPAPLAAAGFCRTARAAPPRGLEGPHPVFAVACGLARPR